jgi:phenylalanyl-tRNA synthetase alpha chain
MEVEKLVESLHPLERKAVPFLKQCDNLKDLMQLSGMSDAEAMRALQWLENKGVLKIQAEVKESIQLDTNGRIYLEKGLPERRFLEAVKTKLLTMKALGEAASLSQEEVSVCLGLLKGKAAITFEKGIISITDSGKKILSKEWLEESFLKKVAGGTVSPSDLSPEERFAFDIFKKRKEIVRTDIEKIKRFGLTELGNNLASADISPTETVDRVTSSMLKDGSWKSKSFRRYDVNINVPKVYGGKRHFENQAVDYIKRIWLDLGFKEMEGNMVQTSFWDLDSLFVPQDHPAREMQDTFYLKHPKQGKLPDKQLLDRVRHTHENGWTTGSTGWKYHFSEDISKLNLLRTHTTVLSAKTIASLKKDDLPAKFFSVGKVYRNEATDASHLFEFYQVEGIVVDPNVNFRHLLGYLKLFFRKMGYLDVRIRPAHFPYTEPSAEIEVLHPTFRKWIELGGSGIFRPEVVKPLLGVEVPVLAWGMGMGRIISEYYNLSDIRDLNRNDLRQLKEMKAWLR